MESKTDRAGICHWIAEHETIQEAAELVLLSRYRFNVLWFNGIPIPIARHDWKWNIVENYEAACRELSGDGESFIPPRVSHLFFIDWRGKRATPPGLPFAGDIYEWRLVAAPSNNSTPRLDFPVHLL